MFIGDDLKPATNGFQQFAGTKQVVGIARPRENLVSPREGLVDQDAAGADGIHERGKKGSVQVVGNQNGGECPARERREFAIFQIRPQDGRRRLVFEIADGGYIAIDENDLAAASQENPTMAAIAACDVEYRAV